MLFHVQTVFLFKSILQWTVAFIDLVGKLVLLGWFRLLFPLPLEDLGWALLAPLLLWCALAPRLCWYFLLGLPNESHKLEIDLRTKIMSSGFGTLGINSSSGHMRRKISSALATASS